MKDGQRLDAFRREHPKKFPSVDVIFTRLHRGDRIFVGTGCGEPRALVDALIRYVEAHPKAVFGAEIFHVWTLGVAPYAEARFESNFRHNSFFLARGTRTAVNEGLADYTPVFLSNVPRLFRERIVPIDVALIQVSPPDAHGYVSLGISVDIVKSAVESATLVIAQINPNMPRTLGETFIHWDQIDCAMVCDEPVMALPNNRDPVEERAAESIGRHIARLVQDGDTLQVGYGRVPNAVLKNLGGKKHLGVHTELLTAGVVSLMKAGVIDNTRKTLHRGKTVASFCMGDSDTYAFLHDNPAIEFRPIDYTNNPLVIAGHDNMTAINSALEIDLTGQATAESVGGAFFSGVGGQTDFMRGAHMSRGGKTILAIPSTARQGSISRIVSRLSEGTGVTLHRGDVHYVVSEYGIAYLHGKNIRERAMELIAIAHPDYRPGLIEAAKRLNLIYPDQAFIPGRRGEYPEELERFRKLPKTDDEVLLRPVKIKDEPLLKDFFYSLSDQSIYRRFISVRADMPHARLQEFVVIDYTSSMVILATEGGPDHETVLGVGQYGVDEQSHFAEVALVVSDKFQNRGVGTALLRYLYELARRQGLYGFTAEVLVENGAMLHLFESMGFDIQKRKEAGIYEMKMAFGETQSR